MVLLAHPERILQVALAAWDQLDLQAPPESRSLAHEVTLVREALAVPPVSKVSEASPGRCLGTVRGGGLETQGPWENLA